MRPPEVLSKTAVAPLQVQVPFRDDASRVVLRLRSALTGLIAALPVPVRGGTDLQRQFGLGSTVAWQLYTFLDAANPLAAAAQLPGRQAFGRLLAAAAERGLPAPVVAEAAAAFDDFEACVVRHAGDRTTFATMIGGLIARDSSNIDLELGRAAFRAASHFYGVQRAAAVNCFILHPGETPGRYDFVQVNGSVDLRIMREFNKLCVGRHGYRVDKPGPDPAPVRPIMPTSDELGGVPVLTEFSSQPLPRFSSEAGPKSYYEVYISGQPVGRTGEVTFFLGEHWPAAAPVGEELGFCTTVLFPSEVLLHDILLAPGVADRTMAPMTGVYGGAYHEMRLQRREADRLNVYAQASFAGVGVEALQTAEVPRYVEMLRRVCEAMGWDADRFDAYRCRLEFPVLHSLLDVTFPAPAAAG